MFMLVGCGVEPDLREAPAYEDGLVVSSADDHTIVGTYGEYGRGLDFQLDNAGDFRFATVGVRGETLLDSVFHDREASTTILGRLTYVLTDRGLEAIGDESALEDLMAKPESSLLSPLRAALRTRGIVDDIVTLP